MAEDFEVAGQVVGGDIAGILLRERSGQKIELGDLLVAQEADDSYLILKVVDLGYGSQIPQQTRELAAGLKLEGYSAGIDFMDPNLRNYTLVTAKGVARVERRQARIPKVLPSFFSTVRYATKKDLAFLAEPPKNPIFVGRIRSGSKVLDVDVYLDGENVLPHHVLIPAATGRGKSNLVKVMLWSALQQGKFGILVLDAHDEYYGRDGLGLKDHPSARENLDYYSPDAPPGSNTLVINLDALRPEHFEGIVDFTDAQDQAITGYHRQFGDHWIEQIVLGNAIQGVDPRTLTVLQRKLRTSLGVDVKDGRVISYNDVFSTAAGQTTLREIVGSLEKGKIVVVDTSRLPDAAELLIGSAVANSILYRYEEAKAKGELGEKPPVSVVIEEAARVLAAERLEHGGNVFSAIAREGRKFKVGLIAITQLTSVIPRMILTNINTKVILGNEMAAERRAVIDSAAQDLSDEDRTIASLDKGEAIVSSIFTRFAVPIYTPLFEEFVSGQRESKNSEEDLAFE